MASASFEGLERALFEEAGDALFLFDPESDELLRVNPAAERLTQVPRGEMLRMSATYWFRLGGGGRGGRERLRQSASKSGVLSTPEGYLLRTRDEGVWIPINMVISRLHVKPKTLALITAHDMRAQREAEERLKKLNVFLDSIVANVPLMLFVKDAASLRFELFNKAGETLLGYTQRDLLGKNDYDFFPREEADFFIQKDREVLDGKKLVEIPEEEIQTKRGLRTLHTLKIPILDEKGTPRYLLGISQDITARKRLREFAAQSERLASIGRLAAGVAHEINNPLSVVGNNLNVLERDCSGLLRLLAAYRDEAEASSAQAKPSASIAEEIDLPYLLENLIPLLKRTREGLERVTRIVHSLRGHARFDPVSRVEVDIPDLLATCFDILQVRLRERRIEIERDYRNPTRVRCVFSDIHQVMVNLLINACQALEAMPASHQGKIRVTVQPEGDEVIVEIADNGPGIAPTDLPCLFDPFFTTKDVRQGSGLGLWISHGIINAHGGRIEVQSQPGTGTCFRVTLPVRGEA